MYYCTIQDNMNNFVLHEHSIQKGRKALYCIYEIIAMNKTLKEEY